MITHPFQAVDIFAKSAFLFTRAYVINELRDLIYERMKKTTVRPLTAFKTIKMPYLFMNWFLFTLHFNIVLAWMQSVYASISILHGERGELEVSRNR